MSIKFNIDSSRFQGSFLPLPSRCFVEESLHLLPSRYSWGAAFRSHCSSLAVAFRKVAACRSPVAAFHKAVAAFHRAAAFACWSVVPTFHSFPLIQLTIESCRLVVHCRRDRHILNKLVRYGYPPFGMDYYRLSWGWMILTRLNHPWMYRHPRPIFLEFDLSLG